MKLILAEVYFIGTDFDSDINFSYIMEDGNILHTTVIWYCYKGKNSENVTMIPQSDNEFNKKLDFHF